MNIAWKISTCVLLAFMITFGIVLAIPNSRNFLLNSIAPYSEVYQQQEKENEELQESYINNLILLAETRTSLLNAEFKAISYQNEVGVLQSNLLNTQNNLNLALSQKSSIENTLNDTNRNLADMTQELSNMRVDFDNLNNELNMLIEQESQDADRINELNMRIEQLSFEMSNLQCIVDSLNIAVISYEDRIFEYERQIMMCNETITNYENEIISLNSQIVELQDTIRDLENLNSALNGDDSYKELVGQVISGTLTDLRATDLDGITEIRAYAFYNCHSLQSVELPETVRVIGAYAFANCNNLSNVILPDSLETIGDRAFMGCTSLQTINIPENVYIDSFAFFQSGITEIYVPATASLGVCVFQETPVTNIYFADGTTTIPMGTFNGCPNIQNIYLPATLRQIEDIGFSMHSTNVNVFFSGTQAQFEQITVGENNSTFTTANVVYNYNY